MELISYEEWKDELVVEFMQATNMTPEEARDFVESGDWEEYYNVGMTPEETVIQDMGYWED